MVINGGLECTTDNGGESSGSEARISYFKSYLDYFDLLAEENLGCATMQPFSESSASVYS